MKKVFKYILVAIILMSCAFAAFKITSGYRIDMLSEELNWNLKWKGEKNGDNICFDSDGNMYIAFKDEVKMISNDGKSTRVFYEDQLNISYITFYKNRLYYTSANKLSYYDIEKREQHVLIKDLPNYGDYQDSKIMIKDNSLLVSIGSATNSGVVGEDNKWNEDDSKCDITPSDITLKGRGFGGDSLGAFVPYGNKNTKGQVVKAKQIGNASIIKVNPDTGESKLYAWGIRNVEGISLDSNNKVYSIVGGMEERGLRPVYGDNDYIYEIQEGVWYGWPDYSGGDAIDSPRFRGDNGKRTLQILDNHPTNNPPGPIYQNEDVSSIYYLCIDKDGRILKKDSFVFYDKKQNAIYKMEKGLVPEKMMALTSNMDIKDIEIYEDKIYLLDSRGYVYEVMNKKGISNIKFPTSLMAVLMLICVGLIVIVILKGKRNK